MIADSRDRRADAARALPAALRAGRPRGRGARDHDRRTTGSTASTAPTARCCSPTSSAASGGSTGFVVTDWFAAAQTDRGHRRRPRPRDARPRPGLRAGARRGGARRPGRRGRSSMPPCAGCSACFDRFGALDDPDPGARVGRPARAPRRGPRGRRGRHGPAAQRRRAAAGVDGCTRVAVIGPNADRAVDHGRRLGQPHRSPDLRTPLDALRDRLGATVVDRPRAGRRHRPHHAGGPERAG